MRIYLQIPFRILLYFWVHHFIFVSCSAPPKKETPVAVEEKPEERRILSQPQELALLESVDDARSFRSKSDWSEAKYSEFNESNYSSFPPFLERINVSKQDSALLGAAIFFETNKQRKKFGLRPLRYSNVLENSAFEHSQDMISLGFYSHTSPVLGKETLKDRLYLFGFNVADNSKFAENLSDGFALEYSSGVPIFTPEQNKNDSFSYTKGGAPIQMRTYTDMAAELVTIWMNSPAHRKNILNPNFFFLGSSGVYYKDNRFADIPKVRAAQVFANREK